MAYYICAFVGYDVHTVLQAARSPVVLQSDFRCYRFISDINTYGSLFGWCRHY